MCFEAVRRFARHVIFRGLGLALWATGALAADGAEKPRWIEGTVATELQNDHAYRSDDPGNERNNLTATIEPAVTLRPPALPGLSAHLHLTLEQLDDPAPGENRAFRHHGLYVEEIYLRYETGRLNLRAGKTNPGFGIAWSQAPGIYGTDMAEEYELAERIVLSGGVAVGGAGWGTHRLSAGAFFLDDSPLQHTALGHGRGTLDRADGGAGNTGDFSSFNLTLDGAELPLAGLAYNLAVARQAHGTDGTEDETGIAAALAYETKLDGGVTVFALIEWAGFDDYGGIRGTERRYLTPALRLGWRGWNVALAYTGRETRTPGGPAADDWQAQVSAGYRFPFGLEIDAGWKRLREAAVGTDTLGVRLAWSFAF